MIEPARPGGLPLAVRRCTVARQARQRTARTGLVALLLLTVNLGCQEQTSRPVEDHTPPPPEPAASWQTLHDLLQEAPRLERRQDGLLMELGGPSQLKYTRGGRGTGWGSAGVDGQQRFLRLQRRGVLHFHEHRGGARTLVIRARTSDAPQGFIAAELDGVPLGRRELGPSWRLVAIPLGQRLARGHHRLALRAPPLPESGARVGCQVAWVWLSRRAPGPALKSVARGIAPLVARRTFGAERLALVADHPGQLSFYVPIPRRSRLVVEMAARRRTSMQVWITADGMGQRLLLHRTDCDGRWTRQEIDLDAWGGLVARLDLVTSGEGETARGAWSKVQLQRRARPGLRPMPAPTTSSRPRNVIVVLMDTARQDAFSTFNPASRVVTSSLGSLAKGGVALLNAYNHDNWTKPSVTTALTSRYSSSHGVVHPDSRVPDELLLLPEYLAQHSFYTAAVVTNPFVSAAAGFAQGWNEFRHLPTLDRPLDAEHLFREAADWLARRPKGKRFLLYVHSMDPHVPYGVPPSYLARYFQGQYTGSLGRSVSHAVTKAFLEGRMPLSAQDRRYIHALYDGEIDYHDHHFGRFIDRLRSSGLLDNTLVVVTNDHGEEMFDHGKIGHWHTMYDELLRNPMVLHYPPLLPAGRRVETLVGLVDLAPTIVDLLGLPPMPSAEGRSFLGPISGQPRAAGDYVVAEHLRVWRAARLGRFKLIERGKQVWLFDLQRDPHELRNLRTTHPVALRATRIYMAEGLGTPGVRQRLSRLNRPAQPSQHQRVPLDEATRRQLKALGYIE